MMLTLTRPAVRTGFYVEPARAQDATEAEALWRGCEGRAEGEPMVRLLARDCGSNQIIGVADYSRTFPPEDAGAVWALLRSAGVPMRLHGVESGLYVEMDIVNLRLPAASLGKPLPYSQPAKP